MSCFDTILELTSFRKAKDEVIPRKKMARIIEAGRNTPSPGNVQTLQFVVVEDDHKLEMLSEALGDHRISEAPSTVVIVVDENRMERKIGGPAEEFCMAEAAAGAQNMRLAAQEQGISSVWKTGFDTKTVSEQVAVPSDKKAVATVSFAYTDNPVHSEPRFGINYVAFYDEYDNQVDSFFDSGEWRGLETEKRIFEKKSKGFLQKIRQKAKEVL
jgi:nitroreductase